MVRSVLAVLVAFCLLAVPLYACSHTSLFSSCVACASHSVAVQSFAVPQHVVVQEAVPVVVQKHVVTPFVFRKSFVASPVVVQKSFVRSRAVRARAIRSRSVTVSRPRVFRSRTVIR